MALSRLLWFFHVSCILTGNVLVMRVCQAAPSSAPNKKILIILTNTNTMGDSGIPSGWFLSELAHPYEIFVHAGFEIDSVSPKGGKAPVDPNSVPLCSDDPACLSFQADANAQALVDNTKTPSEINPSDYAAVFYPGGHGPMFDLAYDTDVASITEQVFEAGGVVGAVCHGPAGLILVNVSNGDPIVSGRRVTSISNAEEDLAQLSSVVPFLLETKLREQGGIFSAAPPFQKHVVTDGNLVTGQNPASAAGVANEMLALLV